jgi:ATP diphosphatase
MTPSRDIARLIEIMAALRNPDGGCPWDIEQDFRSIVPYTVEEAYEVADAIARDDMEDLCEELGDLLLQVVYHARMAEEEGAFSFGDTVYAITRKLIRRHPHVFGDDDAKAAGAAKGMWEKIKAEEKRERAERRGADSVKAGLLSDVGAGQPSLARALKLQAKAATVGFDWNDAGAVLAKIREELDEVSAELDAPERSAERLEDEIGDVLFAVVNLARHAKVDPDQALRRTNAKFVNRFGAVERGLELRGKAPAEASLAEMEALWQEAKKG